MPTVHFKPLQYVSAVRLLALAALALLLAPAQAVAAKHRPVKPPLAPAAETLFVRILQSDDKFTYKGRQITTYWTTGRAVSVQVYHQSDGQSRIYYLDPENLHGRLLVSDGTQQWQYDPHHHELLHRHLSPGALDSDDLLSYTLLRTNYLLSVDPQPRTWVDRKVWLVTIKRPGGRTLARRFWVDAGSGLILKREIYREDGKLVVTVAFSDINFHPTPSQLSFDMNALAKTPGVRVVETRSVAESPLPLSAVSSQLSGNAYAPKVLSGYHLVGASTTTRVGSKPLLHLRYSDGLNLVSLFEQRRTLLQRPTRAPAGMRTIQIGAVSGHVSHHSSLTTLNWDTSVLNMTLMGELSLDALQALATEAVRAR